MGKISVCFSGGWKIKINIQMFDNYFSAANDSAFLDPFFTDSDSDLINRN